VDSNADECIHMEPSSRGVTLLMQSADRGETDIVRLLLRWGANVNVRTVMVIHHYTMLFMAEH